MLRKNKGKFPTFNDGMLRICIEKKQETDFGAPRNARKTEDFEYVMKLGFKEMSKRDEDLNFAESEDRTLSMKVKTRLRYQVKKTHMVLIEGMLYSIIHIDYDKAEEVMYLYLEEVRKVECTEGN